MNYIEIRNKTQKFYAGGTIKKVPRYDRGGALQKLMALGWSEKEAGALLADYTDDQLNDDNFVNQTFFTGGADSGTSLSVAQLNQMDGNAGLQAVKLNRPTLEGNLQQQIDESEDAPNDALHLSLVNEAETNRRIDEAITNRKQMIGAKADGIAGAMGFSGGWKGGVASMAVGAAKAIDNLAMGDKNFGAQSEAVDAAVHGVSGALMKSGNPYCVCKGTKVITANGAFVNIEDLQKEDGIIGWGDKTTRPQTISWKPEPLQKECVRIELASGIVLECSTDHPILSVKPGSAPRTKLNDVYVRIKNWEFKEAGQLEVGDNVGLANDVNIWGTKEMWEPYLVGLLIGDGTYGVHCSTRLFTGDPDTWEFIDSRNLGVQNPVEKGKYNHEFREYHIIDGCSHLRELGIYGQTKCNKRLPENIHEYTKEAVCSLLAGLFDTDGTVRFHKTGNNHQIKFYQKNKLLIDLIQQLLIKLGIHSVVSKKAAKTKTIKDREVHSCEYYDLTIKDRLSVINFYNNIHLNIGYKQKAVESIYKAVLNVSNKDNRYLSGAKSDKIRKITKIGIQEVYNLQADSDHTYLANCIITHNCMAAGAALEGANFMTKAGGDTVQGFDVDINSSGYGQMGHMASSSSRDWGAAIGLGGIFGKNKLKAKLDKRNEAARMAIEAADIADSQRFEQEARMDSILNTLMNNQIALAGGAQLNTLGA